MNISDHTDVKTNSDKRCRIRQKLQEMDVSLHAPSQLNKNHENSMQKIAWLQRDPQQKHCNWCKN